MLNGRTIKVLLVDDDEEDYMLTRDLLSEIQVRRYELHWVDNYRDGLEEIRSRRYDICLIDYRLGAENGLDLLSKAIDEGVNSPMILLTGQGEQEIDEEAMSIGAADYMVKGTFDAVGLDRSIRYALRHFSILEQVRQLHEDSERQVQLRTAELAKAVDDLQEANIAIRESRNLLMAIAHNFPSGSISVLDKDWKYVFMDGEVSMVWGVPSEKIIGTNFREQVTPEEYELLAPRIQSAFAGQKSSLEISVSLRYFICYVVPLPDIRGNVNQVMLVNQDITRRKKAEEEVILALQKEKQLSELKSRFVSMASHEFRTPLATILSSVSLIARYNAESDEEKRLKHINRIQSSVRHLTDTLNDFLSLGKLEEGIITIAPSRFNIVELCEDISDELQEQVKEGQMINYQPYGVSQEVVLDKQMIRNILINLLTNAIKYSPENSIVLFETVVKDTELIITVADQGIGIPPEDRKHMFSTFFRAHNVANIQGTGLGLNIVKKYLDLMKGGINFTSELNKGTIFTVTIPINEA